MDVRQALLHQHQAAIADLSNELSLVCKCLEGLPHSLLPWTVPSLVGVRGVPVLGTLLLWGGGGHFERSNMTPVFGLYIRVHGCAQGLR